MRFLRVDAVAFGPLHDQSLEFGPGMNVFCGPNESGKSSWQMAIYAALCGRRRAAGRPRRDEEFEERYRPWYGGRWEARCQIEMDNGRKIELRHELIDRVNCRATDITTGADLSSSILFEGTPDGSRLLGLNRQIMRPTLFVNQADILAVREGSGDLQECLQRAASAGSGDATARRAVAALERFADTSIGGERAAKKPLRMARDAREASRRALTVAQDRYDGLHHHFRELDEATERVDLLEAERQQAEGLQAQAELAAVEERLSRLRPLAAEFAEGPPPEPAQQGQMATEVAQALAAWQAAPQNVDLLEGGSPEELEAELRSLPAAPVGATAPSEEIETARQNLVGAQRDLLRFQETDRPRATTQVVRGTTPAELRDLAGELEREAAGAAPAPRRSAAARSTTIGGSLLAAGGAIALALGLVAVGIALLAIGALMALTGGILLLVRRELASHTASNTSAERARQRLQELGVGADVGELRRLANELDRALGSGAEEARHAQRLAGLETEVTTAAATLSGLLTMQGVTLVDGDVEAAYARYREECRSRRAQADLAGRRPLLERQLIMRRQQEEQRAVDLERMSEAEERVREVAAGIGLAAEAAIDLVAVRLDDWLTATRQQAEGLLAAWKRYQQLTGLLDGRTLEEWEADSKAIQAKLQAKGDSPAEPLSARVRPLAEIDVDLRTAQARANQLKGQVRALESELPDMAALEEAVDRSSREVVRIEALADIVAKTTSYLRSAEETVNSTIAPRLKASIEARLPAITLGRYREVAVDPHDLAVKVRASGGELHPAMSLSHGTAEQVYLLLRVALAENLVVSGESAPLILDDVTIQSDSARAAAILELLHEISGQRQIILFSQEEEVAQWGEAHLASPTDRLERLEILDRR